MPTTWPAASAERNDVAAAIALASDGDTVTIPADTADWTAELTISKAITLQGAGVGQTIIRDAIAARTKMLMLSSSAGLTIRMTGIEFQDAGIGGLANNNGVIQLSGTNTNASRIRVDHCKFNELNGTNIFCYTALGVIDNCHFELLAGTKIGVYVYHDYWDDVEYSDASMASPVNFGSEEFLFVEDCTANRVGGVYAFTDAYRGARYVVRNSQFVNCWLELHGTDSGARTRGARAVEVYDNTFQSDGTSGATFVNFRSGTGVVYNNTITNFASSNIRLDAYRRFWKFDPFGSASGNSAWDVNDPANPYVTGTSTSGGALTMTDTSKSWDADEWVGYQLTRTSGTAYINSSTITANTSNTITVLDSGSFAAQYSVSEFTWSAGQTYQINKVLEAFDQPGRGQGTQLSGETPTPPASNDQVDEPIYEWNNLTNLGANVNFSVGAEFIRAGEHYVQDTAMPGYTAYAYPHPLIAATEGGGGATISVASLNVTSLVLA